MDETIAERAEIKKKITDLERQIFNVNKMLKLLSDKDFDTYTFTIEAVQESDDFKDKQVIKFHDFSTLPEALLKALPVHVDMLNTIIEEHNTELTLLDKQQEQLNQE